MSVICGQPCGGESAACTAAWSHGDVPACAAAEVHVWIQGPTAAGAMFTVCAAARNHVGAQDLEGLCDNPISTPTLPPHPL